MGIEMPEKPKYDREFREGAFRIVEEAGKPIAQVGERGDHGQLGAARYTDPGEREAVRGAPGKVMDSGIPPL